MAVSPVDMNAPRTQSRHWHMCAQRECDCTCAGPLTSLVYLLLQVKISTSTLLPRNRTQELLALNTRKRIASRAAYEQARAL